MSLGTVADIARSTTASSRGKFWVFTLNNYTPEEETLLNSLVEDTSNSVAYLSYGKETGDSGTPHLQGQLEVTRRITFSALNTLLGGRVWLGIRRGTFEQAQEYVEKDGDVASHGERVSRGSGSRSDLEALKRTLDEGNDLRTVADTHFKEFLKFQRGISAYRIIKSEGRNFQTQVIVYWGNTGTGKTRAVYDNVTAYDQVFSHQGGTWFDGYDDHNIALFDEFSGSYMPLPMLLKLCDRYPLKVAIKGGFVNWRPREIYITSNINPIMWYPNAHQQHVQAMFRRIGNIVHFE